jgi:mannan endo-1,4-beta-mannosidase
MQINLLKITFLLILVFGTSRLFAQRLEAENATLSGGAKKVASENASGGYYVAQEEGSLSFDVSLETEGFYNILMHAASPNGEKTNSLVVNGSSLKFVLERNSQFKTFKLVNTLKLSAGEHQIKILKDWGWINIDYIELEKVSASDRFNLDQTLVTPDPIPEATALYDFLLDNYGRKIISGAMTLNDLDNSDWIDWIEEKTGKEVALLGLDLMHSFRGHSWISDRAPIIDAKNWYARNGIPALMWHWPDPLRETNEFYTEGTDFDVSKIFDEESAEYKAIIDDIDRAAELFLELQEDGVPLVWRPMHEAAGGWFWWGAKGPEPLKELWHVMYDRLVNHHGIRNLIWVWTREPNDEAWYPGHEYVDIVARDIYREGDHGAHVLEFNEMNEVYDGRKMLTIGEIGSIPDPDKLIEDGAAWSWFMPWYDTYTTDPRWNTEAIWQKTMNHAYVITLDEMPDLRTYERQNPEPEPEPEPTGLSSAELQKQGIRAFPVPVTHSLIIRSEEAKIENIRVYNLMGTLLMQQSENENSATVSFANLAPGIYLVRVNETKILKVIKE